MNSTPEQPRNGVLMCMNGTGILNSWLRKIVGEMPYDQMNQLAAQAPVGVGGATCSCLSATVPSAFLKTGPTDARVAAA